MTGDLRTREQWRELGQAMLRAEISVSTHGRDFHEWYGECVDRASRVLDADPDTPTADDPECCASGRCEVCSPGFDWARNGALPDAPVDDGLVEQIARVLDEYLGAHLFKTGDWSRRNVNAMALAVVVARPWQAEVDAARQDAHALAKAWDDRLVLGEAGRPCHPEARRQPLSDCARRDETTMSRPKLLDLYAGAGGSARGYQLAGFHVTGIDTAPQPRYAGDEFHQDDALKFLLEHHAEFDAFHASPPCQAFTLAQRIRGNNHPDYIAATRNAFELIGKPWVIENVEGAPLRNPVMLCGAMFPELLVYRHRLFEANFILPQPGHPDHVAPLRKMGRNPEDGEFMHVVGNFSNVAYARRAMGISWMTRDELRESVPPAYTALIGRYMRAQITRGAVA